MYKKNTFKLGFLYQKLCNPQKISKANSVEWIVLCKFCWNSFRCLIDVVLILHVLCPKWFPGLKMNHVVKLLHLTWFTPHKNIPHVQKRLVIYGMTHGKMNKTTPPSKLPSPNIAKYSKNGSWTHIFSTLRKMVSNKYQWGWNKTLYI